jgi:hypothetical protein
MVSLLKDYKRPNDKVYDLVNEGVLLPVRKGLYVAGPAITTRVPEPFLLANHIMGPSYVSLDMALSYYGLIPERVFEITSMTTKATREFRTPVGLFSYTRLPLPYYAFGIRRIKLSEEAYAMVASPEKALTDKIITTSGIILRSQKQARSYLLEDLRMDEDNLKQLDTKMMLDWLADAPKKETLSILIKMIGNL